MEDAGGFRADRGDGVDVSRPVRRSGGRAEGAGQVRKARGVGTFGSRVPSGFLWEPLLAGIHAQRPQLSCSEQSRPTVWSRCSTACVGAVRELPRRRSA